MRPFKFFFMFSLGLFFFFFMARFVIMALFAAAVLSTIFFLARKMRYFFQRLDWDEYPRHDRFDHYPRRSMKPWQFEGDLLTDSLQRPVELVSNYRVIKVQ